MKDRPNINPLCVGEAGVGADSSEEEDNNDGGTDGDGDFVPSGTEGTDDNTFVHVEISPTESQKRKAAVIRSPMNVNKKGKQPP